METITGERIQGETIRTRRVNYVECTFTDCKLIFDGAPHVDVGCSYLSCDFFLEGAAVHTLQFLRDAWDRGGWHIVEETGLYYAGKAIRFVDDGNQTPLAADPWPLS